MRRPDPQRSRVVLIGTGRYADDKLPDLSVVGRTIGDLAAALTDPVYGVVPENHCTALVDQGDIRLLGRHLRSAARSAEDLLLVYFVGHGLVAGRRHELYLGLPDSEWAEPEFNSLEYDKLRSAVLNSAAATKIIILDCCFSGRVVSEAMADPVTEMVGQMEVDGTYVLASAGRDQVALIQPGEDYTAFTGRFLHLLRNGVPDGPVLLTIDYLYRQLVMRMKAEGLSQPQKRGTSTADPLALTENRAFVAKPPTPAAPRRRRQEVQPRNTRMQTISIRNLRGEPLRQTALKGKLLAITNRGTLIGVIIPATAEWLEHLIDHNWVHVRQSIAEGEEAIAAETPITIQNVFPEENAADYRAADMADGTVAQALDSEETLERLRVALNPSATDAEPEDRPSGPSVITVRIGELSAARIEEVGAEGQILAITHERELIGILIPVTRDLVGFLIEQNLSRILYNTALGERQLSTPDKLTTLDQALG